MTPETRVIYERFFKEVMDIDEVTDEMIERVDVALRELNPREERMLKLRFGLDDNQPRTLKAIGDEFSLSTERVRQIISKGSRKLRHPNKRNKVLGIPPVGKVSLIDANKDTPIEALGLSIRSYNCLKRAGINTLGQILAMNEDDYRQVKNLGNKSTKEILEKVEPYVAKIAGENVEKVLITHDDNPYILDYVLDTSVPALTEKNAMFIEAVVGLDSNYNRDTDINSCPDDGFDVFRNVSKAENKYCGSSAYWFNQMLQPRANFEKCLLGAIISIDRTNSTHLEAARNGRLEMKRIIMESCHSVYELKRELNRSFINDPSNHLIFKMCVDLPAKGKNGMRSNLSFASKFCAYASRCLKTHFEYSKYDNVVSKHLKDYIDIYLKQKITQNTYKYSPETKKKSEDTQKYLIDIYTRYYQIIGDIIVSLRINENIRIDRNEFDHIVWYGYKGQ